jgi:hypothetical protein
MQQENYLVLVAQLHSKDKEYEEIHKEKLFKTREIYPFLQQSIITAPDDGFMVKDTFKMLEDVWEIPAPEDQFRINQNFFSKYSLSNKKSELQKLDKAIERYLQATLPGGTPIVIVGAPRFLTRIVGLIGFTLPEQFWGRKEIYMFKVLIEKTDKKFSFSFNEQLVW